jgi:protein-S-isoprenylcysteine O-methyltransferase Ste14
MIALGNFLFKIRNGLFPLAILLLLVPSPPLFDDWRIAAVGGVALALVGQLVRASTVGLVYIIRGGREGKIYAKDLITDGLFSHCRNPLYVGNYLGILGALVASNSIVALVVGGLFFLIAYVAIVQAEENFLRGKFGEPYDQYCREVPRFGVKLRGLTDTFRSSQFNWGRLLVKEYGTIFTSLTGIPLIILLVRHLRHHLTWFTDGWDSALLIVIVALSLAYLLARWLKKSGRVTDLPQAVLA